MGGEIGQSGEWNANAQVDWRLLDMGPYHRGTQQLVEDLNRFYVGESALWRTDFDGDGFRWIDSLDNQNSVLSFARRDPKAGSEIAVILNLTPVLRRGYRLGLSRRGRWRGALQSDAPIFCGRKRGKPGGGFRRPKKTHRPGGGRRVSLPPLDHTAVLRG